MSTSPSSRNAPTRPLRWAWLGTVPYVQGWELQRRLASGRAAGEIDDCVILLEHSPVYTFGRNTDRAHLGRGVAALRALGAECHEVDRGGSVTFHGPGQLVAYPIVQLAALFPAASGPMGDVVGYVRALEAALIRTAASSGIVAERRPGYHGAWVGREKLAAIGVKLSRGVTQHGLALNVNPDLGWFRHVVPCGITDGGVTSLAHLGAGGASPGALAPQLARDLAAAMGLTDAPADASMRRQMGAAAG